MILLWGLERETPLARVGSALASLGADVTLLDQDQVMTTRVQVRADDGSIRGHIETPGARIDLRRVRALYARPFSAEQLLPRAGETALHHAQEVERALWTWAELTPAVVVNRASAMAPNQSKPFQAAAIKRAGFRVPATLVTTSPAAARAFWKTHGEVIYKSLSGVRSRVARLRADHAQRLADVVWCPTQFQQHVPGLEHRVHVVGERVFTCQVVSDADDYRYANSPVSLLPAVLPESVAERCVRLTAEQQLLVAGLDLRRTPDDEWYCFEVNPSPGFPWYEEASGPIAEAIAQLLMRG